MFPNLPQSLPPLVASLSCLLAPNHLHFAPWCDPSPPGDVKLGCTVGALIGTPWGCHSLWARTPESQVLEASWLGKLGWKTCCFWASVWPLCERGEKEEGRKSPLQSR